MSVRRRSVTQDGCERLEGFEHPYRDYFYKFGLESASFHFIPFFYHSIGSRDSPGLCGNRPGVDGGGLQMVLRHDRWLWLAIKKHDISESARVRYMRRFCSPRANHSLLGGVEHNLNWYRFISQLLGKAMYEGILVGVAFAGFYLAKVRIIIRCICA